MTLRREEIDEGGGGSDGDLLWSLVASSWGCGETMSGVFGTELLMCQKTWCKERGRDKKRTTTPPSLQKGKEKGKPRVEREKEE